MHKVRHKLKIIKKKKKIKKDKKKKNNLCKSLVFLFQIVTADITSKTETKAGGLDKPINISVETVICKFMIIVIVKACVKLE